MGRFAIGQSVSREEDPRLLRGEGQFLDDQVFHRLAQGYVLRSPHAHARIKSIDVAAAKAAPGVLLVLTGADYAAEGFGRLAIKMPQKRRDGSPAFSSAQPGLVENAVKYVGDYVAFVVAETLAQAKDAAELIEVDYDPLPAITATDELLQPGAIAVWEDCPDNQAFVFNMGDKDAVDRAFETAAHTVSQRLVINRITSNSLETRNCVGDYDRREERYTLHVGVQGPHSLREQLANEIFNLPEHRFRVIAGDMGGGFGMKGGFYPENLLVLWAAKKIGRPVKWVADRAEGIVSDHQARDNITEAELALDEDARFLALRVRTTANIGAYYSTDRNAIPAIVHIGVLAGTYITPAIHVEVTAAMSNLPAVGPYRGAGRPEAAYVIERMVELAGLEMGLDAVEIRRRNTVPADAMPFKTGLMYTYDSGEFEANLDLGLEAGDYAAFEDRRAAAKSRGKLRGIGISNTIELAGGMPIEAAEIRFDATATVTLLMGTKSSGQGHETMYKQMICAKLGIDSDTVKFVEGDTDKVVIGRGTFGSRSAFMGGSALMLAADKIIAKGKQLAAHILEVAEADISFADGDFTVTGTDKSVAIADIAMAAFTPAKLPPGMEPGLCEVGTFRTQGPTFPNGCHVCEVEIDEDTGKVDVVRYSVVDDVGVVINPKLLKGQIHGGIVQGAGQILMEDLAVDRETGQVLAGSFMDYAMPKADDFPLFEVRSNVVPTKVNPLGAKGGGEAGTVGAVPATMNAIIDALAHLGVRHLDMPATSEKIWRIIQKAKGA